MSTSFPRRPLPPKFRALLLLVAFVPAVSGAMPREPALGATTTRVAYGYFDIARSGSGYHELTRYGDPITTWLRGYRVDRFYHDGRREYGVRYEGGLFSD